MIFSYYSNPYIKSTKIFSSNKKVLSNFKTLCRIYYDYAKKGKVGTDIVSFHQ